MVLSEGFHFINPFWSIQHYDIRTQKVEADADAASKDLQSVTTKVAVNFRVSEDKVRALYQETEGKYERTLIAPALQEAVKAATAQFTAEELITKRTEVKDAMRAALAAREAMRFFVVEDVSIVNFSFSTSFNEAIERKVTAEQDALAAKNKLEQIQYEADQKVVTAKAEAESLRIQSEALANNASLIELEAVRKWNGVLPAYMMGNTVPFVNVGR
ncbi:MAG: prohibitin family protein [Candidatus Omnitrophota bacterium]|nr:prohibitin family protein [Candidatus Omnitrophota bacterium]